jgi:PAS domain S-box-containing protein
LGERAEIIAATVWEVARPLLEGALAGQANFAEDLRMDVSRGERQTESHFTFSYTPLTGDDGRVGGIFCPVVETTQKVIGARRLRALGDLAACQCKGEAQVLEQITNTLARYADDLPFVLTYLAFPNGHFARVSSSGSPTSATWVPATIDPGDQSNPWPIAEILRTGVAANVERNVGGWPADEGSKSPEIARILPLQTPDGRQPSGVMIVGLSPRLLADDQYYGYLDQVAGLVATLLATIQEITERQQAEEELRGAKQRLESLLENSPLAVVEWSSADYRIVRWSDEATRVFGWTAEETVGKRINELDWIYPEDQALVEQVMGEMLSGKSPRNVNKNRNLRKDGAVIHCEWYNSTLHDPSGKFSVLSLVLDVTERKRAEQALERSNLKLAEVLASIQDDFYVLDRNWKFAFASKQFTSRIGKQPEDFLGNNIWEMFPKHVGTVYEENLRAAMDKRETRRFEVGGRYTDAWYRMTASPSAEGITVLGTEITENKRIEEALRESEQSLREADQRKTEFLGVLSHELRNPLTPIRNSLYILDRATPGGEQSRRAHSVIDRQVNHLARLVDDLLDVTRISRGKIHLQRTRLDLVEVVHRTIEDHRSLLDSHEVAVDLPKEAIWIDGDPTRLAQLFGNLLNNAAKFTPEDGKVSVSLSRHESSAVIEVADTGLGIDPETLKRLFEPFAQADRSLDRSRGGLGLGLALVKGMVELHGGEVSAHSDGPGKGARFTVSLPLDQREVAVHS